MIKEIEFRASGAGHWSILQDDEKVGWIWEESPGVFEVKMYDPVNTLNILGSFGSMEKAQDVAQKYLCPFSAH